MVLNSTTFLYILVFLAVITLVLGIEAAVGQSSGRRKANKRMQMIDEGATTQDIVSELRRQTRGDSGFQGPVGRLYSKLDYIMTQGDLTIGTRKALLVMLGGTLGTAFILLMVTSGRHIPVPASLQLLAGAGLAILIGAGIPYYIFNRSMVKRHKKFLEQLPDALDVMIRSLRAGHPVAGALGLVTEEMPDPIGTEFGLAIDEMKYGLDLQESLKNLADRVAVEEFRYVVVAISIQSETGGNLAEVLSGLSEVIRGRAQLRLKVKALSSEGRMSALVLTVLPFVTMGLILTTNPAYYTDAMGDPIFAKGMGLMFILMLLGMYVMKKMVNFKV